MTDHFSICTVEKKNLKNAVKGITCDVHNQQPQITVKGKAENYDIQVSGCCTDLVEKAQEAISSAAK